MSVSDYVEEQLMRIGATPEYTGYKYLVQGIIMSMQDESLLNWVTTGMYPAIPTLMAFMSIVTSSAVIGSGVSLSAIMIEGVPAHNVSVNTASRQVVRSIVVGRRQI